MRRAAWQTLPKDRHVLAAKFRPRTWRFVRETPKTPYPSFPWRGRLLMFATFSGLACLLAFGLLFSIFAPLLGAFFLVFLFLVTGIIVITMFWRIEARPSALDRLAPDPLPEGAFTVRLILRQTGGRILRDEAWAVFVDGWLYVEGLRTAFCLRACDVGSLRERPNGAVHLELPEEQRAEFEYFGLTDAQEFRETFRLWRHYTSESPPGESLFPPSIA